MARAGRLPWREIDARGEVDVRARLDAVAQEELAAGFPGMQPPLIRFALVRTGEHRHHFIWTMHHVLLDGWSTSQLMAEVLRHYAGEPDAAPAARYGDYIRWLQHRDAGAERAWWTGALGGVEEPTLLARCLPRAAPAEPSARAEGAARLEAGEVRTSFTEQETARLQAFARRERITLNTLVQAAWALVLQRHAGQETVVFGTTVAGRPAELPDAERAVGLFINTLPMACTPRSGAAVGDWLRELQAQGLRMREHEHTPLYDIQRWMGTDAAGLFDTLLVFENYPVDGALHALPAGAGGRGGRAARGNALPGHAAGAARARADAAAAARPRRIDAAAAGRLADQLVRGLRALAEDAGRALGSLDVLAPADIHQAPASAVVDGHDTIHRLFERQARLRPDAVALRFEDDALTYGELDRRANRLRAAGAGPEARVGVALGRGLDLVVSLLAVLKSGAAYVPLDPDYPPGADRLHGGRQRHGLRGHAGRPVGCLAAARGPGRGGSPVRCRRLARHAAGCGGASRPPRLRDLHLGLHRAAQGGAAVPSPGGAAAARHRRMVPLRPRGRLDAVPLLRVRFLRVGTLRRALHGRAAGRRPVLGEPFPAGLPGPAAHAARDRAQPDTVGLRATGGPARHL